ncbi:hypothetical protein ABZT03_24420 [Streptomyces sp. NPDC005574]|uniref:hypothetical protein n=1 Tax=Streptomyces sp. NPDC005574 TaxID=3156891 RepID=UPI0033ADBE11
MAVRTPAEQALARSYSAGDGGVRFGVAALSVDHRPNGHAVPAYRITVERAGRPDERWAVDLPLANRSFTDVLTASVPEPDRLRQLVGLVHALLEEWWDTKGHDRRAAKRGRRLP